MTDTTILVITALGLPPYSTRGATQTLQPISAAASMRRTVNGDLIDLSVSELRKFRSTITCTDQQPPAFNGIWPGQSVVVDCISELAYEGTTDAVADRTAVSGSERTEDGWVFYRPQLTMRIMDFRTDTDEYGAAIGWTLELEEA